MLRVISLHTIKQIFETESLTQLSPMAKMSYISCLMYYFEDMPLDLESTNTFDIIKAQIKSYNTTQKYFNEMQEAGLVKINHETITFFNHWRKYIDKSLLNKPTPEQYLQQTEPKSAKELQDELFNNKSLFELIDMRHKLPKEKIIQLIKEFIKEGEVRKIVYYNPARCAEHCFQWFNKKAPSQPKITNNPNGKILGR